MRCGRLRDVSAGGLYEGGHRGGVTFTSELLRGRVPRARTPPDRGRAGLPDRAGERQIVLQLSLREQRDQVRQLADRFEITELGQPFESERVQLVAEQQRQVAVVGGETTRGWP